MKKLIILTLLLTSCSNRNMLRPAPILIPPTINLAELNYMQKTLEKNNYLILDLRSKKDYNQGHITGALSLPYVNITSITNIPNYQHHTLLFYDKEEVHYYRIRRTLYNLNTTNFYLLDDGYRAWSEKNTQ